MTLNAEIKNRVKYFHGQKSEVEIMQIKYKIKNLSLQVCSSGWSYILLLRSILVYKSTFSALVIEFKNIVFFKDLTFLSVSRDNLI